MGEGRLMVGSCKGLPSPYEIIFILDVFQENVSDVQGESTGQLGEVEKNTEKSLQREVGEGV